MSSNTAKTAPSLKPDSDGLTGGVCKEQGLIHRGMLIRDYYGFQLHEGELQPSIGTRIGFRGLTSPFGVVAHCPYHCSARVAQKIWGIPPTVAYTFLLVSKAVPTVCPIAPEGSVATVSVGLVRCQT